MRVTHSSIYLKQLKTALVPCHSSVAACIWCTSNRTVQVTSVSCPCCSGVCPLLEVRAPSPGLQAHLTSAVATNLRASSLHLPSGVRWRMAARCCPLMLQDAVLPAGHPCKTRYYPPFMAQCYPPSWLADVRLSKQLRDANTAENVQSPSVFCHRRASTDGQDMAHYRGVSWLHAHVPTRDNNHHSVHRRTGKNCHAHGSSPRAMSLFLLKPLCWSLPWRWYPRSPPIIRLDLLVLENPSQLSQPLGGLARCSSSTM